MKISVYRTFLTLQANDLIFSINILEYADVIWDNSTLLLIHKIETVQIEAAGFVTGGTKLTSIDLLYKETGWQRLTERLEIHRLTYFYKMFDNLSPPYSSNIVPKRFQDIHNYNTRNSSAIQPSSLQERHYILTTSSHQRCDRGISNQLKYRAFLLYLALKIISKMKVLKNRNIIMKVHALVKSYIHN